MVSTKKNLAAISYLVDKSTKQLVVSPTEAKLVRDFLKLATEGKTPAQIAELATRRQKGNGPK